MLSIAYLAVVHLVDLDSRFVFGGQLDPCNYSGSSPFAGLLADTSHPLLKDWVPRFETTSSRNSATKIARLKVHAITSL